MSSADRTTNQRRRIAVGLGAATGGVLAAAFISMGTAQADTEQPDPFTDIFGANGASLDAFLTAVNPGEATEVDAAVDAAPTPDTDPFADFFGPNAAFLDSLLPASFATQLDTFYAVLLSDADPFADFLGATTGAPIDSFLASIGMVPELAFLDMFA
jgi:hypothetical protein